MMEEVYDELNRPENISIRTWDDALKPLIQYVSPVKPIEDEEECFTMNILFRKLLEGSFYLLTFTEKKLLSVNVKIPYLIKKQIGNLSNITSNLQLLKRNMNFI